MTRVENVIRFYMLCSKLKDVVRTGWQRWSVQRERIESIADHVFGVQNLAIIIKSEYEMDVDIAKVVFYWRFMSLKKS